MDNSEIQHRVLKELPLLGAIEGFSKIKDNRRLSAEDVRRFGDKETVNKFRCMFPYVALYIHPQTKKSFATGMDNLLNLANDAFFNKVNRRFPAIFSKYSPFIAY